MVQCQKLKKEAKGLDLPPYPGAKGQRVFNNISQEAWRQWLSIQTMIINERHLSPRNPEDRKLIEAEMEKFLFGEGTEMPAGYTPPKEG